jgi:hypothetical protein
MGAAKPSNQKNEKAQETAWDLRRIPSVRCTLYRHAYYISITLFFTYIHYCHLLYTRSPQLDTSETHH